MIKSLSRRGNCGSFQIAWAAKMITKDGATLQLHARRLSYNLADATVAEYSAIETAKWSRACGEAVAFGMSAGGT
jgi:hypothetical protein